MTTATQTLPTNTTNIHTRTARVKHVVPSGQVAHLWAHQSQDSAKEVGMYNGRSRFYFEGDTIYSYGPHFPIARHVQNKRGEKGVLITTGSYSKTTSGHVWAVRGALQGLPVQVFHVQNPGSTYYPDDLKRYAERFAAKLEEAAKSRKYTAILTDAAVAISHEAEAYCKFFGLRFTPAKFKLPADLRAHFAKLTAAQKKAAAQAKAKREKQEAEYLVAVERALLEWLAGAVVFFSPHGNHPQWLPHWSVLGRAYFRPVPGTDEIMTTLGARFPAEHGRRAYRLLRAIRAKGESYHANGHTIHVGAFQVDSYDHATGVIKAGCHLIDWSEVERLAAKMGW